MQKLLHVIRLHAHVCFQQVLWQSIHGSASTGTEKYIKLVKHTLNILRHTTLDNINSWPCLYMAHSAVLLVCLVAEVVTHMHNHSVL